MDRRHKTQQNYQLDKRNVPTTRKLTDLLSGMDSVAAKCRIGFCCDPHAGQGISINFVILNQARATFMLWEKRQLVS